MSSWLTLAEAAALLGVHPNTVRRWANEGRLPSQRTSGGHRRFDLATLTAVTAPPEVATREAAMPLARPWRDGFEGEALREVREVGQRLLGLLIQYLTRQQEDPRYLDESRSVGRHYGAESAAANLSMVEMIEAFLFFRSRFSDMALRLPAVPQSHDEEELRRVHRRLDRFMNEVLLGTVEGYEATVAARPTLAPRG